MTYAMRLALVATLAVGCAQTEPIPIEDYPDATVEVSCRLLVDCCAEGMRRGYADQAACEADRAGSLDSLVAALQPSITAGRIAWNADAAGECVANVTCGEPPAACSQIFTPLVEIDGACTNPLECIDGVCEFAMAGMLGVCVVAPGEGDMCSAACADGLRCDFGTMTCVPLLAEGEPCTSPGECVSRACDVTCRPNTVASLCAVGP